MAVADGDRVLGVIHLKDIVKGGMKERIAQLREMGIRTVMITGDNPLTAAAIAAEAGVDDFLAQATPADKMEYIKKEQAQGRLVAMTGDGTNDAPALAQADVGVAMNTGTMAAKEAGNMVDLDCNPTKLIEVVAIGKQLLITRGALTTFSIANDVAKYFAIIPAMFMATYPALAALNIMGLHTPQSAVLSAVIFNALIIIALVPLALRGVKYRPESAARSAAPKPAGLRTGRHHRPVPRYLADRSDRSFAGLGLKEDCYVKTTYTRVSSYPGFHDPDGSRLSRGRHRALSIAFPEPGQRESDRQGWPDCGLEPDRAELHAARIFSSAPFCGRVWLRCFHLERIQPRADQPEAVRPGQELPPNSSGRRTRTSPGRSRPTL